MDWGKIMFGLATITAVPTMAYMVYFSSKNEKDAKWPISLILMFGITALFIAGAILIPNLVK